MNEAYNNLVSFLDMSIQNDQEAVLPNLVSSFRPNRLGLIS